MSKNIDIQIKEIMRSLNHVVKTNLLENISDIGKLDKQDYDYNITIPSKLVLEFTGKNNANVILNTLRRVMMNNIPSYAFCPELIKITDNTTLFNNDYMKLRLSQLSVLDTELDIYYLDPIYWLGVDYSDPKRPRHSSEKQIEIAINAYNDTNHNKNITTNDIHYYEDGIEVYKYNKENPILLIQLRPAETFKCSMRAALGVGERDNIWAGAGNAYYNDFTTNEITGEFIENKNNKKHLVVESQGQCNEYMLLVKACNYIVKRLDDIKNDLNKKFTSKQIKKSQDLIIILDGEDHTMGQLLNYSFQNHPEILFSGISKPDHLVRSIKFKIACSDKFETPLIPMYEQIDQLKETYLYIEKELIKLENSTKKKKEQNRNTNIKSKK